MRTTWAPVASIVSAMIRLRWLSPRITASPFQKPFVRFLESLVTPTIAPPATTRKTIGHHQASPSGPISVNEQIAARQISTTMIGISAAISVPTFGHSSGAVFRSAAIRIPTPIVAVDEVAEVADRRGAVEAAPADRAAGGLDADVPGLAAEEQPDDLERHGGAEHEQRGVAERRDEVVAHVPEDVGEDRGDRQRAGDGERQRVARELGAKTREATRRDPDGIRHSIRV